MALASWWLFLVVTFPWENQEEPSKDDWLSAVAFAMFGCAVVVLVGAVIARAWFVVPAFALGALLAAFALRYALVEWSDHADGKLVAFALVVGGSGLLACVLTVRAQHGRSS